MGGLEVCQLFEEMTSRNPAITWTRFLSLVRSKLRLCSANHREGYLPCDWPSTAWSYCKQETENGPWATIELSLKWSSSIHPKDIYKYMI